MKAVDAFGRFSMCVINLQVIRHVNAPNDQDAVIGFNLAPCL